MKSCEVEVVTGFLGWGKTTFIDAYIDLTSKWDDNLVVIETENGKKKLDEDLLKKKNIYIKNISQIDENRLNRILSFYEPKRMIIELNCMTNINIFESNIKRFKTSRKIKIVNNIAVVDACTIEMFMKNMQPIIEPVIRSADIIFINKMRRIDKVKAAEVENRICLLNSHAHIIKNESSLYDELKSNSFIMSLWR